MYKKLKLGLVSLLVIVPVFLFASMHAEAKTNLKKIIPEYDGINDCIEINDNTPFFTKKELKKDTFDKYKRLDRKGRCKVAFACIDENMMPNKDRGSIGHIKPSGWHTVKYKGYVDGNYLYNRCHLIAYQLTGCNSKKNLITGTRHFNNDLMKPYEDKVAEYIKDTGNKVLYRVTPYFEKRNKLATGVLMEAQSIEDDGDGIKFCVFCYNVQPKIKINYKNGESELEDEYPDETIQEDKDEINESAEQNTNDVKDQVNNAINEKKEEIKEKAKNKVNEVKNEAKNKAKKALKGLFN